MRFSEALTDLPPPLYKGTPFPLHPSSVQVQAFSPPNTTVCVLSDLHDFSEIATLHLPFRSAWVVAYSPVHRTASLHGHAYRFKSKRFFVKHDGLQTFGLARFLRNRRAWFPFRSPAHRGLLTSPPDCFASRPRLSVQVQAFLRQTRRSANFRTCTISSKSPCLVPFSVTGAPWPTHQSTGLLRFTATPIGSSPHLTGK